MNKVEDMHIADILDITNLYVTPHTLLEIWKDPAEYKEISKEKSVLEMFRKNPNYIYKLMDDEMELYKFLVNHDDQIDKPRFLMTMVKNFKERLLMAGSLKVDQEEIESIQDGLKGAKSLLKGMDKTFVFYNTEDESNKVSTITIMNSKEELEGIDRKKKNSNIRRLKELQKDIHLGNIIQALWVSDVEYIIPFEQEIGFSIRYAIEYNAMLESRINKGLDDVQQRISYLSEMSRMIEAHIEEINIDKLLLCSACRYIKELENHNIKPDEMSLLKKRLQIIERHIKQNVKIDISVDENYSIKDFKRDLKRFIGKENITYISREQEEQIIKILLAGELEIHELGEEYFNVLFIEPSTLTKILKNNPNNYILFLKQDKCAYDKNIILKDIINTKICSEELLQALCENADITSEEICDLFDKEIISVSDLKSVREEFGEIITNTKLFEQYKKYREKISEGQDADLERMQLERYALAYRNTELIGKEETEIQEKGEEFITEVGDEIEASDIMQLYSFDIIPLTIAVDWGGEEITGQLLESESLKPADAKFLRNEGLLNEKVLERLFKKCHQMSYAYQVALVYAVFDGQTPQEQKIREKLAQYYHIENGITNSTGSVHTGKRRKSQPSHEEPERKIKMRDPGAKYNLLAAIDKDVKIEEGIIDGHIIFHYPNMEDGTVLIEKLHRITTNKENGLIEIKPDNKSATYVLSEEEFIKMKSQLIQDGKVDRTELTQRWWITRDPEHWVPHTGISGWEQALKERFLINTENQRYTQQDLVEIQNLIEKSIESKREER